MLLESFKWLVDSDRHKLPPYLIFFVTSQCNSRCRHCFYQGNLNKRKDMSLDEIEKVSEGLNDIIWLTISGGEPFLRKDLSKICKIFCERNNAKKIAIPTNCLMPETIVDTTKKILDHCNAELVVNISLDGLQHTHDWIRGVPGNFDKVLEVCTKLAALSEENNRLLINATTVVSNRNFVEIQRLLQFVKLNMKVSGHNLILLRGTPTDKSFSLPSIEVCRQLLNISEKYADLYMESFRGKGLQIKISKVLEVSVNRYLNRYYMGILNHSSKPMECKAGKSTAVIEPDGRVRFCELTNVVGNLRDVDYDFKSMWFSKQAEGMRKGIIETKCCCFHPCFNVRNVLFNPRVYPRIFPFFMRSLSARATFI